MRYIKRIFRRLRFKLLLVCAGMTKEQWIENQRIILAHNLQSFCNQPIAEVADGIQLGVGSVEALKNIGLDLSSLSVAR